MTATLNLVTGILGSGKTTTLKHLIEGYRMEGRPGVVVGEYADEGFDGAMLGASGASVRQITSTGRGEGLKSYLDPVRELVESGTFRRIYLETSGVTEIRRVAQELVSDETVRAHAVIGRTVTVLDAGAFVLHDTHFSAQLWSQVDVADVVVVNKTDRVHEAELAAIRDRIAARGTGAQVLFSYMGQVRCEDILGAVPEGFVSRLVQNASAEDTPSEFESFVYRSDGVCFDRIAFGHQLLNLPGGRIARFKGTLCCWDRGHYLNGFPGQLDWDNTPVAGPTAIAFIGLDLARREAEIRSLLDTELARQAVHDR